MIEFRNVGKEYRNHVVALDDISFTITDGEFVFCIGESGAGKSTIIKLLTCEEKPTAGTVILDNFEVSRLQQRLIPNLRRKIGMIFQDFRLIESKTIYENVAFAMEIVGASARQIKRRVPIVLSVVGLRDKADSYPSELSGGEMQRAGVARAIINNPRLILADEPTGNLDPANGEAIMALLEEINHAGTTVVCCTHDVKLVDQMRKRVIELRHGRLLRDEKSSGYVPGQADLCLVRSDDDLAALDFLMKGEQELSGVREDSSGIDLDEVESQIRSGRARRRNRQTLSERVARMRLAAQAYSNEEQSRSADQAADKQPTGLTAERPHEAPAAERQEARSEEQKIRPAAEQTGRADRLGGIRRVGTAAVQDLDDHPLLTERYFDHAKARRTEEEQND